jgi:hypothetical protein
VEVKGDCLAWHGTAPAQGLPRKLRLPVVISLLVLVIAGCGGGSTGTRPPGTSTKGSPTEPGKVAPAGAQNTPNAGRPLTWTLHAGGPSGSPYVSCTSTSFCLAIGISQPDDADAQAGNAFTFNGTSWSGPTQIEANVGDNLSVSCASSDFCAVVDGNGNAITFNGSTFSAPMSLNSRFSGASAEGTPNFTVSCPTNGFCMAIDSRDYYTYDGTGWASGQSLPIPDFSAGNYDISCADSSFCAAVNQNGTAITLKDGTWSSPTLIDQTMQSEFSDNAFGEMTVSCPSASFCAAIDSAGNDSIYNGSTWTTAAPTGDTGGALHDLSCPSTSFCAAVDSENDSVTYFDGSTWASGDFIAPGASAPLALSCPSASLCVATGDNGYAIGR